MNVHAVEVDHRSEKRLIAGFHALYSLGSMVGALAMATLLNVGIELLYAAGVWLLICIIIWGFSVNSLLPDAGKRCIPIFCLAKRFRALVGIDLFFSFYGRRGGA